MAFAGFWLVLQLVFATGVEWSRYYHQQRALDEVSQRVSLDMGRLPLASIADYQVESGEVIARYIQRVNQELAQQQASIRLLELVTGPFTDTGLIHQVLITPSSHLILTFADMPRESAQYFSVLTLLLSLILTWLYYLAGQPVDKEGKTESLESLDAPRLIIDLQQRTLRNSSGGPDVVMANKPLCFYVALLEFCARDRETLLSQNKEMPEALQLLADKYFLRLVALGHTVRKRPNFKNSLEKTLSDIRAVLDEVYSAHPELKLTFYPPKAHGEGSRSKLHHYGLRQLSGSDYEILGR
ncbi:hypothetical protein [Shewanella sp. GXUN23E]|uniref:hypothetical protein n=1 Tax=Shewanella sp. GXUN23E TaxID=3422498 RepID=UPI003D7ECD28